MTSLIPRDFLFQLTQAENADGVANCDHLQNLKFSQALPFAFTEHGAIQAANVLASSQAGPFITMATNIRHLARFAGAFPVALIVSTLSAKSLRHMEQLARPFTKFVATLSRQTIWEHFVNLLQMHKDGITVAEYWTELPPKGRAGTAPAPSPAGSARAAGAAWGAAGGRRG